MSGALLHGVQKLQADIAGVTGPLGQRTTRAATSGTELVHSLLHGESGTLHYLFDGEFTAPVSTAVPYNPRAALGPNGGTIDPNAHAVFPAQVVATTHGAPLAGSPGVGAPVVGGPGFAATAGVSSAPPASGPAPSPMAQRASDFATTWRQKILGR